ncbi:MAG: glutathione S-transferase N-terminal domain-containing protein [Pseudomonadota bacterium]
MLRLYHWEPNANSDKPMLALAEKGVQFESHYYVSRISSRPAVRAALATSRSGRPAHHFVPGVEPSRWG